MTRPESEQPPAADRPQDPKAEDKPSEKFDPVAANPFYRGLRVSEVVRLMAVPPDPEVRERIMRRARRGSGPRPGREPDPGT